MYDIYMIPNSNQQRILYPYPLLYSFFPYKHFKIYYGLSCFKNKPTY